MLTVMDYAAHWSANDSEMNENQDCSPKKRKKKKLSNLQKTKPQVIYSKFNSGEPVTLHHRNKSSFLLFLSSTGSIITDNTHRDITHEA